MKFSTTLIHMLGPLVFTKISFTSWLYLTFIAFIRKENYPGCHLLQWSPWYHRYSSHTPQSCPSRQLLPPYPWPRVLDSTHDLETLRYLATMPQEQRWSKNQGSWPLNGPGHGQTLQQLSAKKNWYNSEMVVFTKIVIISAVSDGFLKFQKFWHRDTYGMTCSTAESRM